MQYAVDAVTQLDPRFTGFEVDIGGAHFNAVGDQFANLADDRGFECEILEMADVFGAEAARFGGFVVVLAEEGRQRLFEFLRRGQSQRHFRSQAPQHVDKPVVLGIFENETGAVRPQHRQDAVVVEKARRESFVDKGIAFAVPQLQAGDIGEDVVERIRRQEAHVHDQAGQALRRSGADFFDPGQTAGIEHAARDEQRAEIAGSRCCGCHARNLT